MMTKPSITAWSLALAGVIPFVGLAALSVLDGRGDARWQTALLGYGAVILSFLGGTRWGREMASGTVRPLSLVVSNLAPLVAWVALWPGVTPVWGMGALVAGLLATWAWDLSDSPAGYRALRSTATVGAVLSLVVVAARLASS